MEGRDDLEAGTVLDTYRIVRTVGAGGFGVTYEAEDLSLGTTVAIKEYFPDDVATRIDGRHVRASSDKQAQTFEWGRNGFLEEARTLARFKHPSIVQIYRIFETNSTAYMVMAFEAGPSLERWLRNLNRRPSQHELDNLLHPLLDALELMHANAVLHRDIAPDNIIIRGDGSPVLLDFGAARKMVAAKTHALTGMFKQGYSPQEQYSSDGKYQGPWSDVYALAATLYRAVTGAPPEEAPSRVLHDTMVPAVHVARGFYREEFLAGLDACLMVRPADRPQSVQRVRDLLLAGAHAPSVAPAAVGPPAAGPAAPPTARIRVRRSAPGERVVNSDGVGGVRVDAPISSGVNEAWFTPGGGTSEWFRDAEFGPEMVVVPGLGASPPFAVGRYVVTFAEWDAAQAHPGWRVFSGLAPRRAHDHGWGRGRQPAIDISWHDAQAYCAWLSSATSRRYRLPSEAEWEHCCRAGAHTAYWWGDDAAATRANFAGAHGARTLPVDRFAANPWGLYQVHGNVWEWCEDSSRQDLTRIVRGGSCLDGAESMRAAARFDVIPRNRDLIGFRLVRVL